MFTFPSHQNPNDTFWLARHAHNVLAPLIEAARQYEPTIRPSITLNFDIEHTYRAAGSFLDITAHWDRIGMFLYEMNLTTKEGVDKVAAMVQTFIDTEQAALEAAEDAKAEEQWRMEQADALADIDWVHQQERRRERADIERDEHDRDTELQNIAAGN